MSKWEVIPLAQMHSRNIMYSIQKSTPKQYKKNQKSNFQSFPIGFDAYKDMFDTVQNHIKQGDTYLLNLTAPTAIETQSTLKDIYHKSSAQFRLLYEDLFVSFSPERFVKIQDNTIQTHPMKGTIDASIQDAQKKILENIKEKAEHTMVVDLLRNDLSMVAQKVKVEAFRYSQKIHAGEKELFQISSHISATLESNWQNRLGDILTKMLPAGSITGTPKKKTTQIIHNIEGYDRGFYTGVWGIFDGQNLDSSVLIRYIEKNQDTLVYKSGGGITSDSDVYTEYQELLDKIYIPH